MSEQPYKWMTLKENFLIIEVKVVPNSSKNCITIEEEFLKIKLTAIAASAVIPIFLVFGKTMRRIAESNQKIPFSPKYVAITKNLSQKAHCKVS